MLPVTVHTSISGPREQIFDLIADMAARVAWCHHLKDFRLTSPRTSGVGASARFRLEAPLHGQWAETAIVEADRPRRIVEEGRSGRLGRNRTGAVYELIPQAGGVTRVELTFWSEPARRIEGFREGFGARRRLRRASKRSLERLRELFEEYPDAPLPRATIAGYEPLKAPRFGVPPRPERTTPTG